jgi:hypothetical protein
MSENATLFQPSVSRQGTKSANDWRGAAAVCQEPKEVGLGPQLECGDLAVPVTSRRLALTEHMLNCGEALIHVTSPKVSHQRFPSPKVTQTNHMLTCVADLVFPHSGSGSPSDEAVSQNSAMRFPVARHVAYNSSMRCWRAKCVR